MERRRWGGRDRWAGAWHEQLVLAACLLGLTFLAGCGATSGLRNPADTVDLPDERLYAAASTSRTDVEPTVVEPTVAGYPEPSDPLMPVNRAIFAFNDVAYRYALFPLNRGYRRVVPQPVRTSIGNFFSNLRTPISSVNHFLQGRPQPAGRELMRFGINTTIGLLGFFDPATSWFKIEAQKTTFEQTLTRYGTGQGIYLVLPLLGPADTRNGAGRIVDYFLHPLHYLADGSDETLLRTTDSFQQFPPISEEYETIRKKAEDPYIFFRNLYWQGVRRDVEY